MPRIITFILLISIVMPSTLAAQPFPTFKIMTELWPTYQFEEKGELKGISVDVFVKMLAKVGSKQGRDDIAIYPWKRAYQTILHRPNTIVFLMNRTKAREKLFKWVGPLVKNSIFLFMKKGRNINITDDAELKNYYYGVARDDVGEQLLLSKGVATSHIYRSVDNEQGLKMLFSGRVDFIPTNKNVRRTAVHLGINPDTLKIAYRLSDSDAYYAFHRDTPDTIVNQFQTALDQLKQSGEVEKIIQEYQRTNHCRQDG